MSQPLARLRAAIDAFRHDEALERVRRARGADDAESEAQVAARHAWLAGPEARETLERAASSGDVDEETHGALAAHLARAAADVALAPARDRLERAARERLGTGRRAASARELLERLLAGGDQAPGIGLEALSARAADVGLALERARADADVAGTALLASAPRPPDAGPKGADLVASATALLDATDALAEDAVRWLTRSGRAASLESLLRALRVRELDGLVRREGRFRRLGEGLAALGLERDLAARVTVAAELEPAVLPRARVVTVSAPTDVRIIVPGIEMGLVSELAGAEALGRALGLCLAAPALPVELRRPIVGSVARALGVLLAQLLADRVFLRRVRGLAPAEVEALSRRAAALLVLDARLHAAAIVARATSGAGSSAARAETAAGPLGRALCAPVDPALARLVTSTPAALGPRVRARLGGHALALGLRERHDEDWFRAPRAAEPLRAAAQRGGSLSVEAFCEELGVSPSSAADRLHELYG
jgi:hypothetical protein